MLHNAVTRAIDLREARDRFQEAFSAIWAWRVRKRWLSTAWCYVRV